MNSIFILSFNLQLINNFLLFITLNFKFLIQTDDTFYLQFHLDSLSQNHSMLIIFLFKNKFHNNFTKK